MKKISVISLAIILSTMLTATTQNSAVDRLEDLAQQHAGGSMRGFWNGNVFVSEHLGFQLVMPDDWETLTDRELAELAGSGMEYLIDGTDLAELMELAGVTTFIDMVALSTLTLGQVQIIYERIPPVFEVSVAEYMEISAEVVRQMGFDVNMDFPGTTRIGAYDWLSYEFSRVTGSGTRYFIRSFIIIKDDFGITVNIRHNESSESLEEILAMFNPL